jgi:hypothetical protein
LRKIHGAGCNGKRLHGDTKSINICIGYFHDEI